VILNSIHTCANKHNSESKNNSDNPRCYEIRTYYRHSKDRIDAENFIRQQYAQYYQADIEDFYPQLLSLYTASDKNIQAISGPRCAQGEQLFSEYYLQQTIEQELSKKNDSNIIRSKVAEVGNLALTNRSQIRSLIIALIAYLYAADFSQMVFTTIPVISNSFKRVGLPVQELADARLEHLPQALQQQWGNQYYQLSPKVYALDIQKAHQLLMPHFQQASSFLRQLWLDGYALGEQHFKKVAVA